MVMQRLIEDRAIETRSLRRISLLVTRASEDSAMATPELRRLEPLLHRIERTIEEGAPLPPADVEGLEGAGEHLARMPVRERSAADAIRRDLAAELSELARRLRSEAPKPRRVR